MDDLFMYRLGQKRGGGGGKPAVIESLTVNENGTYTPSAGVDGFSPVTVNVAASGGDDWYITDANHLFRDGARFDLKDILLPKCKEITGAKYMFQRCSQLTELDVSEWDMSRVTTIESMFEHCNALTKLDVSKWDTSNVTLMSGAFNGCSKLTELDVSEWDTSKVTNMWNLFNNCSALTRLDLSKWDTSNVTGASYLFGGCSSLTEIIGMSATKAAGLAIGFPFAHFASGRVALKRLTFRTDLPDGVYSIRSAIDIKYCSFERDGMVEMFNTLPDVSGLGLSSSYTTITITGNPCVTDGSLTAEDEAIATSKGWTLVK